MLALELAVKVGEGVEGREGGEEGVEGRREGGQQVVSRSLWDECIKEVRHSDLKEIFLKILHKHLRVIFDLLQTYRLTE